MVLYGCCMDATYFICNGNSWNLSKVRNERPVYPLCLSKIPFCMQKWHYIGCGKRLQDPTAKMKGDNKQTLQRLMCFMWINLYSECYTLLQATMCLSPAALHKLHLFVVCNFLYSFLILMGAAWFLLILISFVGAVTNQIRVYPDIAAYMPVT